MAGAGTTSGRSGSEGLRPRRLTEAPPAEPAAGADRGARVGRPARAAAGAVRAAVRPTRNRSTGYLAVGAASALIGTSPALGVGAGRRWSSRTSGGCRSIRRRAPRRTTGASVAPAGQPKERKAVDREITEQPRASVPPKAPAARQPVAAARGGSGPSWWILGAAGALLFVLRYRPENT